MTSPTDRVGLPPIGAKRTDTRVSVQMRQVNPGAAEIISYASETPERVYDGEDNVQTDLIDKVPYKQLTLTG